MKKRRNNESTLFLLPMLAKEISFKSNDLYDAHNYIFFKRSNFVNAYMADKNKEEYNDKILLYYTFQNDLDQPIFERKLEHLPTYLTDYDYDGNTVYVFDIPDEWNEDYRLFKQGKYSELSNKYKKHTCAFWKQVKGTNLHTLFYNTEQMTEKLQNSFQVKDLTELNNPGQYWFMPGNREIL